MKRIWGMVLVFAAIGCSSKDEKSDPATCPDRHGTFKIAYVERDGTCGHFPEQVIVVEAVRAADDGGSSKCSGTEVVSDDGCEISLDDTCEEPAVGAGYKSRTVGSIKWTKDGERATGVIQMTLIRPDGTSSCKSTYDVTFSRP